MAEKGIRIKSDPVKVGWEDSDFPIVCETCLGDNPYVRMSKAPFGTACKVCERPCTRFTWKAGTAGRFKSTVLCQMCARVKNVCQTCVLDLKYGLPVEVRDGVVAAAGGSALMAPIHTAVSDVNRQYAMNAWAASAAVSGVDMDAHTQSSVEPIHAELLRIGRERTAAMGFNRNAAKLCSFFARGECNRGDACPFRHEMPRARSDPLARQNIKDRYFGHNDPVANKIMGQMKDREDGAGGAEGGADNSENTRVWIGGLPEGLPPAELRAAVATSAQPRDVHITAKGDCAFVEYNSHAEAEAVIKALMGILTLRGKKVAVDWARPRQEGGCGPKLHGATDADEAAAATPAATSAAPAGAQPYPYPYSFPGYAYPYPYPYPFPMPAASTGMAVPSDAATSHPAAASGVSTATPSSSMPMPMPAAGAYPYPMMPFAMPPIVGMPAGAPTGASGPARTNRVEAAGRRAATAAAPYYSSMDPARMGAPVK